MHGLIRFAALLALVAGLTACDLRGRDDNARDRQGDDDTIAGDNRGIEDGDLYGGDEQGQTTGTSGMQTGTAGQQTGMNQGFEHFAMTASHAEIELGRLAQRKAQNEQVKQFATQIVNDHTKALQELQRISGASAQDQPSSSRRDQSSSAWPRQTGRTGEPAGQHPQLDPMHQQVYDRLNSLSGQEFDREFMRVMVEDHQKVVDRFQQQSQTGAQRDSPAGTTGRTGETSMSDWAKQTLPTLQKHLERAQRIQSQLNSSRSR